MMIIKYCFKVRGKIKSLLNRLRGLILFNSLQIKIEHDVLILQPKDIHMVGSSIIKSHAQIKTSVGSKIFLGDNSVINSFSRLEATGGNIKIGNNTAICSFTTIETAGGYISLGNNIVVGEYSTIQGQGGVVIEDNVLLASHVHFISNHHEYTDISIPIKYQRNISKRITIMEDTWIGINVTILSGVTIGKHCIIGSGSIVNCDIPDYSVAVGNPVRILKRYNFEKNDWVLLH